ncbi:MAG: hypothetical protein KIT84_07690 [Labilithrix sp.]|nr:hypothetical protein [Labilithrix sp.]MCW5810878.1 hypothetical protein [Labilithrix sp.]
MKLGALMVVVSAMAACAPKPAAPPTSTTQLTSAEITPAEDAPKTGKPQLAKGLDAAIDDEAKPSKDSPRKPGGGFSGYK